MYYALRRLGKEVEWVRYVNGGHRPPNSNSESIDFETRKILFDLPVGMIEPSRGFPALT